MKDHGLEFQWLQGGVYIITFLLSITASRCKALLRFSEKKAALTKTTGKFKHINVFGSNKALNFTADP